MVVVGGAQSPHHPPLPPQYTPPFPATPPPFKLVFQQIAVGCFAVGPGPATRAQGRGRLFSTRTYPAPPMEQLSTSESMYGRMGPTKCTCIPEHRPTCGTVCTPEQSAFNLGGANRAPPPKKILRRMGVWQRVTS